MEEMTIHLEAYCIICKKNVKGNLKELIVKESGKWLHVGECPKCFYEIKRIV